MEDSHSSDALKEAVRVEKDRSQIRILPGLTHQFGHVVLALSNT